MTKQYDPFIDYSTEPIIRHNPIPRTPNGSPACPKCGGPTHSCIKADDVCENEACGYVRYIYSNTSVG